MHFEFEFLPSWIIVIFFIGLGAGQISGQSQGTNLLEFQYGKIPGADTSSFPSIYDRTTLSYRKSSFRAAITIEQYHSEFSDRNYMNLAQGLLQYKKKKWDIKLGNFYETLGRGVLLRAFEIKGAVIEELGFRSRQYFHRDFLGASVKYKTKKFTIQAMRADVLNTLAPTFGREDRRVDLITGLALSGRFLKKHKAGLNIMHYENPSGNENTFGSLSLEGPISDNFNYYAEFASGLSTPERYAFYSGITGLIGNVSFNVELKKYVDFLIGSGINEPPALIQDQTYRLLNRTTHVSNPIDEDGYQIDLSYSFDKGHVLLFNHALARNKIGAKSLVFREFFLEWSSQIKNMEYKLFLDYSEDPFKGQSKRITAGFYSSLSLSKKVRIQPEIEWQSFKRSDIRVYNQSIQLGLNYASKLNVSVLYERTNDPFLMLDSNQTKRNFTGINIAYKPNYKNSIRLFFGERQGGPACSSGVCYEILDFKGFETRWTTRF